MGVGVFSSDFGGTGGTFLIDGPLGGDRSDYRAWVVDQYGRENGVDFETWKRDIADVELVTWPLDDRALQSLDEAYADYLFECGEEDAPGYENWLQDEVGSFVEDMQAVLSRAADGIGLSQSYSGPGAVRADFDRDFALAASGEWVQVGWRGREHDFVIGVGGDSRAVRWAGNPDGHAGVIFEELGMSPDGFASRYARLVGAVENYFRLSMMQAGYQCRYRTSGYTTAAYSEPEEGFDEAIAAAVRVAREASALLGASFEDNLASASEGEREEMVGVVLAGDSSVAEAVPLLDVERDEIRLYLPERLRFHRMSVESEGLLAAAKAAAGPQAEFSEVPLNASTAAEWSALQRRVGDHLLVSLKEWTDYSEDLVVRWQDEDGEEWESDATPAASSAPAFS